MLVHYALNAPLMSLTQEYRLRLKRSTAAFQSSEPVAEVITVASRFSQSEGDIFCLESFIKYLA